MKKYFCAGPSCPGYSYAASDTPHPATCAYVPLKPRAILTGLDLHDAAAFLRGETETRDGRTYAPGRANRDELAAALDDAAPHLGLKGAIRRVMGFLDQHVEHGFDKHEEADRLATLLARQVLSDLHDWITEDV